mmetsp:Transcript_6257/g.20416  ORF Transcript_6257/g.20416 Transcript_6257/m.20416 type:complete len:241 (+) Transcript_6257:822-1544(+)
MRMVRPTLARSIASHMRRRCMTSVAAVGSSRMRMRGPPARAHAKERRRCMPCDRRLAYRSDTFVRCTSAMRRSTSASLCSAGTMRRRANNRTCSRTVNLGHKMSVCCITPMFRRTADVSCTMDRPPTKTSPLVGASAPVIILIVVDFPQPLWPSSAMTVPGVSTVGGPAVPNVTVSTARTAGGPKPQRFVASYVLDTDRTSNDAKPCCPRTPAARAFVVCTSLCRSSSRSLMTDDTSLAA